MNANLICELANDAVLIGITVGPHTTALPFPLEIAKQHLARLQANIAKLELERNVRSSIILGNGHGPKSFTSG